jgi:hypothetical protein
MMTVAIRCLAAALALSISSTAFAQEPKSGPLAKQLAAALDAAKLDSIAAQDPSNPGTYFAALYFPGSQLLVVSAKYSVPELLDTKLSKREFRDVYIDLNSASVPETKEFIEDLAIDGIRGRRADNQTFDTYEMGGKRSVFDGDWRKQKLSEQDYLKTVTSADERYTQILNALIAEAKKAS